MQVKSLHYQSALHSRSVNILVVVALCSKIKAGDVSRSCMQTLYSNHPQSQAGLPDSGHTARPFCTSGLRNEHASGWESTKAKPCTAADDFLRMHRQTPSTVYSKLTPCLSLAIVVHHSTRYAQSLALCRQLMAQASACLQPLVHARFP